MDKNELLHEFENWTENYELVPEQEDIGAIKSLDQGDYVYMIVVGDEEANKIVVEKTYPKSVIVTTKTLVYLSKTQYILKTLYEDVILRFGVYKNKEMNYTGYREIQ
jgi:hypothetical protein